MLAPTPETLRSLREEVLLLSRLVDDLQTVAVAEAGRLSLERVPVSLRDLVDGALDSIRAVATERGLTIASAIPDLPMINADPTRIGQVLRNLLANALTATSKDGRIEVSAHAEGDFAHVFVTDPGSGMAREHLAHLFERFIASTLQDARPAERLAWRSSRPSSKPMAGRSPVTNERHGTRSSPCR